MRGLRTQENDKFKVFFERVQQEAKRSGAIFFLDSGMGRVTEGDELECEDLCGWMIPFERADEFEAIYLRRKEGLLFDEFYRVVDYELTDNGVKIVIE